MERAVAGALRELRQPERLLRIRLDLARELVHDCVDRAGAAIPAGIVRTAALAGAKPKLACLGGRREEQHVLAQRAARGAGRAAVDPRGLHRVDELARAGRVTAELRRPRASLRSAVAWTWQGSSMMCLPLSRSAGAPNSVSCGRIEHASNARAGNPPAARSRATGRSRCRARYSRAAAPGRSVRRG